MLVVLLIAVVAGTAWSIWAYTHPLKRAQPPAPTPDPTPVEVEWDERVDRIDEKRQMLDRIFAQHQQNDDDVDPPTVVADRR